MSKIQPFHLAIPVHDLAACRKFYRDILGCEEGRSSDHWVDFNFFGHQLVIHYKESNNEPKTSNPVDGKDVPVPHFGVVLSMDDFNSLAEKLKTKSIEFIIEPYTRFKGLAGEQSTLFFKDPSGNALEFKSFKDINQLFAI
ncbi:MAG: VOC family protein [Patiriisocius sp.]|uniref:VOC family protein n=1 Tax=Patiriisocius sp. TaxID=2822396 RepID=UPI003EF932E7